MAKVLDLNTYEAPTLDLTFTDKARTKLRVTLPTEAMIQELEDLQSSGKLEEVKTGSRAAIGFIFDLMARLLSYNRDMVQITAEDLRGKYNVDLTAALVIMSAYMDFITELTNAKN